MDHEHANRVATSATAQQAGTPSSEQRPARRPYAPPRLESGPAFEQVMLSSGCNSGIFDCEIPC